MVWAPGEVRDVPHTVAQQVCQAHPSKMELYVPTLEPEPVEAVAEVSEEPTEEPLDSRGETDSPPADVPEEVSEDFTEKAVDRAQRGGRRRSAMES